MSHLVRRIILVVLIICALVACRQPVGSIDNDGSGNGSGIEYDFLMLRPNRILYEVNAGAGDGIFNRNTDLKIFVADSTGFRTLDNFDNGLLLEVIFNPGMSSEKKTTINTYFPFSEAGRYVIRGTYGGKSDEYSVEVRGTYVNPGDGNDFFDFIWL